MLKHNFRLRFTLANQLSSLEPYLKLSGYSTLYWCSMQEQADECQLYDQHCYCSTLSPDTWIWLFFKCSLLAANRAHSGPFPLNIVLRWQKLMSTDIPGKFSSLSSLWQWGTVKGKVWALLPDGVMWLIACISHDSLRHKSESRLFLHPWTP